jgi:hypothetical protein
VARSEAAAPVEDGALVGLVREEVLVLEDGNVSKVAAVFVVSAVLVELCTGLAEEMVVVIVSLAEVDRVDVAASEDVLERLDGVAVTAWEDVLEGVPAGTMVKFMEKAIALSVKSSMSSR